MVPSSGTLAVGGRIAVAFWRAVSGRQRQLEAERPIDVLLKVRYREPENKWRSANFSVTNQPGQQLVATRIELGFGPWGSFGARIAPAIIDGDRWLIDERKSGRTILFDHILRGAAPRQNIPFFLHDPQEIVDKGRHWLKLRLLLEHRTDASRYWWTGFYFPLPQEPGDDILFNRRGPHR
jgi:hypothetical protein